MGTILQDDQHRRIRKCALEENKSDRDAIHNMKDTGSKETLQLNIARGTTYREANLTISQLLKTHYRLIL